MKLEVAASPVDENEREDFRFHFIGGGDFPVLRLVRFRRLTREEENADWEISGEYVFPDLANKSTLPRPEIPAWAIADAKTLLFQHIQIQ